MGYVDLHDVIFPLCVMYGDVLCYPTRFKVQHQLGSLGLTVTTDPLANK